MLPDEINGARVLRSAESRDSEAPWVVICETESASLRYFIVSLVTRAGHRIDETYHVRYATALEDFRARCAKPPPTT
ncbi:MAG TPA: hypothetical protein VMS55_26100 [Myxococcota bacterium]|nr:hypothetical protein [Myxococcota bacterium]